MANMNDRYMEEYEAARSGRPSIQETLTKAQEQERKKKRHRYEKIGAALLVLIGALSWYFFYFSGTFLNTSPCFMIRPSPIPPATPRSASFASPGPFTTQPMTATFMSRSYPETIVST